MALNITSSDGQQYRTGNPQTVPSAPGPTAESGSVQPGTSKDLLNGGEGVNLGSPALTTVNLDSDPSQIRTQTGAQVRPATIARPPHHVSAAWLAIPVILVLAAAGMFWAMTRSARSAKSTTN